jgi:conserved oligomeric Golgi complex subunit 5
LSTFEALYLSRSTNRINETIAQSFTGGARSPPSLNEGVNIARTVVNELDSARFDPLLVKSVAKNVNGCLEGMIGRADGLVSNLL